MSTYNTKIMASQYMDFLKNIDNKDDSYTTELV